MKNLAIIPARGGSSRIPNKNIRIFNGKPLIYYTIKQAQQSKLFDKVVVDTNSPEIAKIAKKYGAEVPFLRPEYLATSKAKIGDAIEYLLKRLKREQKYIPRIITVLQTTSPLREIQDIKACYKVMSNPKIKSASTICETSPWFFHLSKENKLILVNKKAAKSSNTQEVKKGYLLNGCMVFMIKTSFFMKIKQLTDMAGGQTVGVLCPRWRSVDLDYPEDWVLAELLYRNKNKISEKLKKF